MVAMCRQATLSALPATTAQRLQFLIKEPTRKATIRSTDDAQSDAILRSIATDGFAVLPARFSREWCAQAADEMAAAFQNYPDMLHHHADERLFGLERVSEAAKQFFADPLWLQLADSYSGGENAAMFVMANRLQPKAGETDGSGGGWHRDCFARELKVIVYLTDVGHENGPFNIVRGSHDTKAIYADMRAAGLSAVQNRLTSEQVERLVSAAPSRLQTITGAAGTVIVFDTSAIHAGAPIQRGQRLALTLYMVDKRSFSEQVLAHYEPLLTASAQ